MGYWYNPPPPQPAAVHLPPNAAAATNVAPNPIGSGAAFDAIRSAWPTESWPVQIGDTVAGELAPVVVPPQSALGPLSAANATLINATWPREDWATQRPGRTASLTAPVVTPVVFPSPLRAGQSALISTWLPENWYAQSECAIASGIAQTQIPPIYIPRPFARVMALLRAAWPSEDWYAQSAMDGAAWISQQQPVAPLPAVIRHPEILLWTPDTWGAQGGTRNAAITAGTLAALPYLNRALAAALRSAWLPENWAAQTFPDIAGGSSPIPPATPRPPSQFPISLWPQEFWPAQPGTRDAAILAQAVVPVRMPYVVGELEIIAILQLELLFAPVITIQYVFSGAPVGIVVDQSIPRGTLVFRGEALTLQVSLGRRHGPLPCPIVESKLVCNIPVVLSLLPPNKKVVH